MLNESVLVAHGATDAAQNPGVRADLVFFETPNGGAVFSRFTTNVLRRFADPTPFPMPGGVRPV
jgi:N,N-dimethylformamidase